MSRRAQHRSTRGSSLNDTTDTVFAMALLWVIPVAALLFTFARL